MELHTQKDFPSQGDEKVMKVPNIKEVRELVKKDLSVLGHLIDAIYKDQPTLNALADYLHGRFMNQVHKQELDKQGSLDLKDN